MGGRLAVTTAGGSAVAPLLTHTGNKGETFEPMNSNLTLPLSFSCQRNYTIGSSRESNAVKLRFLAVATQAGGLSGTPSKGHG